MPIVANKVSLFGDSASYGATYAYEYSSDPAKYNTRITGRMSPTPAQHIDNYSTKINGISDYSVGGNTLAASLVGTLGSVRLYPPWDVNQPLRGFGEHILADDCDIALIRVGANDVPDQWSSPERYTQINSSYAQIIESIKTMVSQARAAGKRVAIAGCPVGDFRNLMLWGGYPMTSYDAGVALGVNWGRVKTINELLRCVASFMNVKFIDVSRIGNVAVVLNSSQTLGAGDIPDGIHPAPDYSRRISEFIASRLIAEFNL